MNEKRRAMIIEKGNYMINNRGFSKGQAVFKLHSMYGHVVTVEELENIFFN